MPADAETTAHPGNDQPEQTAPVGAVGGSLVGEEASTSGANAAATVEDAPEGESAEESLLPDLRRILEPLGIEGSLGLDWRGRRTHHEADQDLEGDLALHGDGYAEGRLSFTLSASGAWDFFGRQDRAQDAAKEFRDLRDTYERRLTGQLWEASVSAADPDGEGLRADLGRQVVDADRSYRMDGGRFGYEAPRRFRLWGFGGVPVRQYEGSRANDWLAGARADFHPYPYGKGSVAVVHVHEGSPGGLLRAAAGDEDDRRVSARYWQQLGEQIHLFGAFFAREFESERVQGRARAFCPWSEVDLTVEFERLIRTQQGADPAFGPLTDVVVRRQPYDTWQARLGRRFGDAVSAEAGFAARVLRRAHDEGAFNREWRRWWLRADWEDALVEGLALAAQGEFWQDPGGRTATGVPVPRGDRSAAMGELSYEWTALDLDAAAGAEYARWRESFYPFADRAERLSEEEQVWTWFARVEWAGLDRWAPGAALTAEYRYEREEQRRFQELRVGLRYEF